MTCNLAIWKDDFYAVNGFDECFNGWGYEDSDLIVRLIHNGVKRKEGRFALPVLHLWHKQNDRHQQAHNYQLLMQRVFDDGFIRAEKGLFEKIE
jgi:predicted glycosyltransferase involved in capsule biosynthesis